MTTLVRKSHHARMSVFEPLAAWQKLSRKSDRALAALIGISHSKLGRAKRGLQPLPMEDQLALEKITGITPAEWAEFYAKVVQGRGKTSPRAPKKSLVVEEAA